MVKGSRDLFKINNLYSSEADQTRQSRIDFKIPSKVLGDHARESSFFTPNLETEPVVVSEDEHKAYETMPFQKV